MNGSERYSLSRKGWAFFSLSLVIALATAGAMAPAPAAARPAAGPAQTATAPAPPPDLSQVEPKPFDAELQAELEDYMATLMERENAPGAAVAIVQGGEVVYEAGFGVREQGKEDPVTPETLMMIGSTGKSMTTMMMGAIVDDGLMSWDTPAVEVYPGFALSDPDLTARVTMRHLVCNCTGVERRDLELYFPGAPRTAEAMIESLRSFTFTGEFGNSFQYSNQMVAAGGYLAARAATSEPADLYKDYVDQMQQRVFDPIGMQSTTFSFDEARAYTDRAAPHGLRADLELVPIPLSQEEVLQVAAPAGSTWSNVDDLARYLITQLNQGVSPDGTRVISAENLAVTWEPQVETSPGTWYALGWGVTDYLGARLLTHGGGTSGFSSALTFLPDAGLGIAVLANAQGSMVPLAATLRVLELAYGLPMQADAVYAEQAAQRQQAVTDMLAQLPAELDKDAAAPFAGAYTNESLGEVRLSLEKGAFRMEAGAITSELRQAGDGVYLVWDPPLSGLQVQVGRDAAGQPRMELIVPDPEQPVTYAFKRVEGP